MKRLKNSDDWFVYRTFFAVPPQFLQLYTVIGIYHVRNVVWSVLFTYKQTSRNLCRSAQVVTAPN